MDRRRTFAWLIVVALATGLALWWVRGGGTDAVESSTERLQGDASENGAASSWAPGVAVDAGGFSPADLSFNPGWIGAPCDHDVDCTYEQGFCLLAEEGFPGGSCSRRCDRLCPDRQGDLYSSTFCVEDPSYGGAGACMARCNLHLTTSGCRPGYVCSSVRRLGEAVATLVCLPDRGTPSPPTTCTAQLDALDVVYARPDLADAPTRRARPSGPAPREDHCQVDTPVLLRSPVGSVDFRLRGRRFADHLLVACRLALVLERLARLLAAHDVVEVEHMGTYACRTVAGSPTLSGHGRGLAIDISGFERAGGAPVSLLEHWNRPASEPGRFLRKLVKDLREAGLFDVVLTPAHDDAHRDHLHLELRPH